MAKYTIEIKDLPEGAQLSEDDLKNVVGGILAQPTLVKAPLVQARINPIASGDCDCWSYTVCASFDRLQQIINPVSR